jgi:raffinose/stachyose/melibiose transport system substrate-binding protein
MADVKDGKVTGIPYTVEGFGVVYNKNLIDASKVTDFASFETMLKEQKAAGVNGFSLSSESYFLIGHILNTPFALQADPGAYVEQLIKGEVTMENTPEFVDFAKFMEAIRENTNNPLEVKYDKETGDFAMGKSASIHQGNWCYGMFTDYDINFEMGMMPLPILGNDKIAVSVPTCWYVNSQASDAEIQAGKDFIQWMYTSETGKKYLMEEFGFIPVVANMENEKLDPLSQAVAEYTNGGKTIPWPMNSYWPAGIVDVYLVPVAQEFFTTNMTGTELLKSLNEAFVEAGK